jgi:hypothetical protein
MRAIVALLLAIVSMAVPAESPQQFELTYRFTFNGQYVGNVTDRFKRVGNRYNLSSVARPDNKLSLLLPVLTLTSEGVVQSGSFVPSRYRQVRSNAPEKAVASEFNWAGKQLIHHYKGKTEQIALPAGTQDALTQLYAFTLAGQAPPRLAFDVSNGRKLISYRYEKLPGGRINTPMGAFDVIEYRRIAQPDENAISVWIAPGLHYLPLRIVVREESGLFEQQLIRLNYKAI